MEIQVQRRSADTERPTHKHKHHPIFVYTRTKAHEYANTQKH